MKYSNFLSGLIKIHNKCLSDAISEIIEKDRIDSIVFPWDTRKPTRNDDKFIEKQESKIEEKINDSMKKVVKISNTKLGKLYRRDMEAE